MRESVIPNDAFPLCQYLQKVASQHLIDAGSQLFGDIPRLSV